MESAGEFPGEVIEAIEALGCGAVRRTEPITSAISQAAFVETNQQWLFVKWRFAPPLEMFRAEAEGLDRLRQTGTLCVPEVIGTNYWDAMGENRAFAYIAMEYIPNRKPGDVKVFSRRFAEGLAALHHTSNVAGEYGLESDNFLGTLPQINVPRTCDWVTFYRDNRLLPQVECALQKGLLPSERERNLMNVVNQLPKILDGHEDKVSLIHGDLWKANLLCAAHDEAPVIIDPAVYFAPREMEIAYIELFEGSPPRFRKNYEAVFPLGEGYEYRRTLHQIYPLLIHLNHFGEQYGSLLDYYCRTYA